MHLIEICLTPYLIYAFADNQLHLIEFIVRIQNRASAAI